MTGTFDTLPFFFIAPEKLPEPNRKALSSNHHFSCKTSVVSERKHTFVGGPVPPLHRLSKGNELIAVIRCWMSLDNNRLIWFTPSKI